MWLSSRKNRDCWRSSHQQTGWLHLMSSGAFSSSVVDTQHPHQGRMKPTWECVQTDPPQGWGDAPVLLAGASQSPRAAQSPALLVHRTRTCEINQTEVFCSTSVVPLPTKHPALFIYLWPASLPVIRGEASLLDWTAGKLDRGEQAHFRCTFTK